MLTGKVVITVIDPFSFTDRLIYYPRLIFYCLSSDPQYASVYV